MNKRLHWDDLRIVLAVAEAGSLSGAARKLRVSHATVFRRLAVVEDGLGARLFHRARNGYTPTPAGEEAAAAARGIQAQVRDVERRVAGRDLRPSGTVRLTTTDSLLMGLLAPVIARFRLAYPEIGLEIVVANQLFDLSKREADVALRPSSRPPEALVGRKLGILAQAIYARRQIIAADEGGPDLRAAEWVGPDERMAYRDLDRWMAAQGLAARCRCRVDSVLGMLGAVREGVGLAVLPCYLGDADPALTRIGAPLPELATDLWLLTHPDLRRTARIRAVLDVVADAVRKEQPRLAGGA